MLRIRPTISANSLSMMNSNMNVERIGSHRCLSSYEATNYSDFDYSQGYSEDNSIPKFGNNLSSTLSWLAKSMEDYVISHAINLYPMEEERKNINVLDVACGTGNYAYRMHKLGFGKIIGVDIAEKSLDYARNTLCKDISKDNVNFHLLNGNELINKNEFSNQFDIINASWLFMHGKNIDELELFGKGIYQCLNKNNKCILTGMDWNTNMIGSNDNEWIEFGIHLFSDKYPKYVPINGEFIYSKFAIKGGGRVLPIIKPNDDKSSKEFDVQERINGIDIDYGEFINGYFWTQETLTNILLKCGFNHVQFSDPSEWINYIKNKNYPNTLNENEKYVFDKYLQMANLEMAGFTATL